jgi:hypothetical protein
MATTRPKKFNTSGPCDPLKHYMLPALPRLPDIQNLIEWEEYFILQAPRQSGKTTVMRAATKKINQGNSYYALYCSLAQLQTITDENMGKLSLIDILDRVLSESHVEALQKVALTDTDFRTGMALRPGFRTSPVQVWLSALCARLDKDLVVFFDEADCLEERVLLSFLSQLRDGYIERDLTPFPRTIALIGMRDIRDYKAKIRPDSETLGTGSPFNIIKGTYTLHNFSRDEIAALYAQHTEASGQAFDTGAVERTWYWSEGQPWLVNALASEVIENILAYNYTFPVTAQLIDQAADTLMRRQDTHIASLLARLNEPRIQRILEPMLTGSEDHSYPEEADPALPDLYDDDLKYCLDLGLVKVDDSQNLRFANPVYASVINRSLNKKILKRLPKNLAGKWSSATGVDMTGLLKDFQAYWANYSEKYLEGVRYTEAGPHLLLLGYLQKALNGAATVIPQYATGRGYADIVVEHPLRKYVIEIKIKDNQRSLVHSYEQILGYMDSLLEKEGWLLVFDCSPDKSWIRKISWETLNLLQDDETGEWKTVSLTDKDLGEGIMKVHLAGC